MSSRDQLKGVPVSDAWLQKLSDDSDSADRSMEFVKRPKAKHDWAMSRGNHTSDVLYNDHDSSASPESDDLDDNDADDEDWIAYDHDKKHRSGRPMRPGHKSQGGTVHRQSHQRDRSRAKLGSSLVRPSSQPHLTGQSARTARHPPGRQKVHSGSVGSQGTRRRGQNTSQRNPSDSSTRPVQLPDELLKPRQCFGPGCTRAAARPDTKYCSDECGIKLALRRIEVLLPENLTAMNQPLNSEETCDQNDSTTQNGSRPYFVAEKLDKTRLEETQVEKCGVRDRLIQLENEHQQLDALIVRARKHASLSSNQVTLAEVAKDAEQVEQMEPVVCVTCASEVSMRHALRHMEKCFQKMEGNTVFCANQKEQIMGTPLFCDAYDTQAKAYCKRLKVVCEHFKEPKLPPDTVCGFPFVRDVFVETGDFCCVPRSRCNRHLGWERLRRAQIDLERYRYFIRMDELLQEEQRVQQSIAQRGGLLGMLLHKTVDHKPTVPVAIPSESTAKITMG